MGKLHLTIASFVIVGLVSPFVSFAAVNASAPLVSVERYVYKDYGVSVCGATKKVSNIVLNTCRFMGGDYQKIIRDRAKSCLGGDDINARGCKVISGYRSPNFNKKIGGAKRSQHKQRTALDVTFSVRDAARVAVLLKKGLCKFNRCDGGLGYYNRGTFHVDVRSGKNAWGPSKSKRSINYNHRARGHTYPRVNDAGVRKILNLHNTNGGSLRTVAQRNNITKSKPIQQPYQAPAAVQYRQAQRGAPAQVYDAAVSNVSDYYYSPQTVSNSIDFREIEPVHYSLSDLSKIYEIIYYVPPQAFVTKSSVPMDEFTFTEFDITEVLPKKRKTEKKSGIGYNF